jgi:hypothetical protein
MCAGCRDLNWSIELSTSWIYLKENLQVFIVGSILHSLLRIDSCKWVSFLERKQSNTMASWKDEMGKWLVRLGSWISIYHLQIRGLPEKLSSHTYSVKFETDALNNSNSFGYEADRPTKISTVLPMPNHSLCLLFHSCTFCLCSWSFLDQVQVLEISQP